MAGALYDIHTIEHTWSVSSSEVVGATIQDGVVCPAGERLVSAFGYIQFAGGVVKPLAIEKYDFGDMGGDPDSEGCWARYLMEDDVDGLGGTARLFVICAKETNP